jgi:TetR/AcrR family transcriptional repressor of nem operon
LLRETFEDGSLSPKQKLRRYFDVVTDKLADENWTKGCLVGLLSLEASGQNEALRNRLAALFGDWLEPFALEIAAAQDAGDIAPDFEPLDVAKFLLSSWQGAVLWMKVERGPAALELFKTIMFQTVLAGERLTAARAAAGQPESADGTVRCAGGDRAPDQPSGI